MSTRRRVIFSLVTIAGVLGICELLAFATGKLLQSKWAMWRPPGAPVGAREQISYDEYLRRRDPRVGWPYPSQYGADRDTNGAQRNPAFPNGPKTASCVSLYGDSFTEGGDTTSPDKNWGNVLSEMLGCYVANFGTGGYGTDQAYLRFLANEDDPSPSVILGLHPADVTRNLTRVRDLENGEKWYALKPRFVLDKDGRLVLVPIPDLTEDEYLRVLGERGEPLVLEHESLQPGGPAGSVMLRFPYTVSVIRNMLGFYGFRARLLRYPEYMTFLERGHPLKGLEITVSITREFVELAKRRGRKPLVVILPHPMDFEYRQRKGVWPYHAVTEDCDRSGLPYFDFGPYLLAAAAEQRRDLETFFGPTAHYNDDGNALVARFVSERLRPPDSARGDESPE